MAFLFCVVMAVTNTAPERQPGLRRDRAPSPSGAGVQRVAALQHPHPAADGWARRARGLPAPPESRTAAGSAAQSFTSTEARDFCNLETFLVGN